MDAAPQDAGFFTETLAERDVEVLNMREDDAETIASKLGIETASKEA